MQRPTPPLATYEARYIAVHALVDPRTVQRVLTPGSGVSSLSVARVRKALEAIGDRVWLDALTTVHGTPVRPIVPARAR